MAELTIYLGSKNYSSWSLRPWLALKQAGVAFDEIVIPLYQPTTRAEILKHSPAGHVPLLRHGELTVWDSLAICEYLAELFTAARLWPADSVARAVARAVCAEMHSGFPALRQHLPMNIRANFPERGATAEAQADIDRVAAIWRDCRARFGDGNGDFLFGHFTIADAMFAPVASRFRTYAIGLDKVSNMYCDAVMAMPAMQEWTAAARSDPLTVAKYQF